MYGGRREVSRTVSSSFYTSRTVRFGFVTLHATHTAMASVSCCRVEDAERTTDSLRRLIIRETHRQVEHPVFTFGENFFFLCGLLADATRRESTKGTRRSRMPSDRASADDMAAAAYAPVRAHPMLA